MTDDEKKHLLYLALGEQVALGRTFQALTREASEAVIREQYAEIQTLRGRVSDKETSQ